MTPNVDCETGQGKAANAGQNYPVLTNVYSGAGTQIRGTLDSGTGKTYLLQFFSNPSGNALGYGEGRVFLGQTNLTLNAASCSSNFTVLLPVSVPAGWVVTATATDPSNNTSEFSAWISTVIVPKLLSSAVNPASRQFFPVLDQQQRKLCFAADIQPQPAATVDHRHQCAPDRQRLLGGDLDRHQRGRLLPVAGTVKNSEMF